ncbi:glyoxalase/bleomycin resistance/extradiol dioxygenase family protein [Pseudonocardia sp. ICBG1293]|uniref:VOC family protein n=1 Tax=Pseudonocardia sp. ICBG1293 TaxID=2844382 RepID=UPI001CCDE389|nr:VOC family protein [Pseudonocardia sp. ICBG1293]
MSIHPTLRYDDPRAAITFLTTALGFREVAVHTGDDGAVAHAELAWDDGDDTGLLLIGPRRPGGDRFDTGRAVIYLTCDDPDAVHARAVAAGAEITVAPVDQDYGARECAVADPEGNTWSVGTYRPSPGHP